MPILDLWQDWIFFAAAALMTATSLTAVVYVLSELLMNDKMKTWAKMELVEIFYSGLIISMAIGALPIIDSAVQGGILLGAGGMGASMGMCGGPTTTFVPVREAGRVNYRCFDICGPQIAQPGSVYEGIDSCHIRLGIYYMRAIFDETKNLAFDVYLSYIKTSMIAEFTINVEFLFEKAGFFTFTPWRGFYTMGNTVKSLVFDWAMKIMMLTKFQEIMLRFIATALFPALFVIGALLRTFTFTRRLGGLLLAMAIALYFIYPAFYAFGGLVIIDLKNRASQEWRSDTNANPQGTPDPPIANTMYIRGDIQMIGGSGSFSTEDAHQNLSALEGMDDDDYFRNVEGSGSGYTLDYDFSADMRADEATQNQTIIRARQTADNWFNNISRESKFDKLVTFAWEPNGPIDTLSRLTFWSMFFALFSIIATIASIRSLSTTFGGDIEIAGLTRLI